MKIGIFINSLPDMGGVYQYTRMLVRTIADNNWSGDDLVVFSGVKAGSMRELMGNSKNKFVYLGPLRLGLELLRKPSFNLLKMVPRYMITKLLRRQSDNELHRTYLELVGRVVNNRYKIELMIYPRLDFETFHNGIPFIISVHDLQHRLNPQYPEVNTGDLWEWREYFFLNGCRNALAIFVDSEIGKEDVINCYGTPSVKIKVLPFLPPDYLTEKIDPGLLKETRINFKLPDNFLFYPAQFWQHKNHYNIIGAISRIKMEKGMEIPIVFCGDKIEKYGEFDRVMKWAKETGVIDQVHYLGYVDKKYIAPLYKLAYALIMPTAFGPTNIPVLEAWEMECPVITSNIRGCREQAGDAAILVNPFDEKDIARGILQLYYDPELCKTLAVRGKQRLMQWGVEDFRRRVRDTIDYCSKELKSGVKFEVQMTSIERIKETKPVITGIKVSVNSAVFKNPTQSKSVCLRRISVITPSYNSGQYIEEAIKSVIRQNYPNFEHIIIDGGSTDNTIEIIKRYPHLRWMSKKDNGQSDAMNKGFMISTGDVIVYLNADDFFEPGAFYEANEQINPEKGVYIIAGECNVVKADGSIYVPAFVPKTDFFHMMFWWNAWFPINPASYFYTREVQQRVGGFDVNDHYLMDYDFLLRVALRYKIHIVEKVWGNFRWVETGKSYTRPAALTRKAVSKKYFHWLSFTEKVGYYKNYLECTVNSINDHKRGNLIRGAAKRILSTINHTSIVS